MSSRLFQRRSASPPLAAHRLGRANNGPARGQSGFTLVEVLIVVALVGITSVMFDATMSTVVTRSSQVQSQNILQTEVRGSLNSFVTDLRNATFGDSTVPIISYGDSSVSFYSPDRLAPNKMRKVTYQLTGNTLTSQVTVSTNSNGPPWTWPTSNGPVTPIVTSIKTLAPASGDPAHGGWRANQIFKYCVQSPPDMTIDPTNTTSPELITWSCQAPANAAQVKTVVVRLVVTPVGTNNSFNYGAVATMRWNAS